MWQAFITGFAEKATSLIEERNKEIRDEIFVQMNQRAKENEKIKEKAQLRMEKMRETARDLQSILGNKFGDQTESMVAELLLSGDPETIVKQVREGNIGVDQIGNFVKLDKGAQPRTIESVISGMAPRAKAAAPTAAGEETTAFGLPTRVGEQTRKSFMARTGMTEAEAAGLELPETPRATARFDYDVLRPAAKDTIAGRIDRYSRAVLDAETPEQRKKAQDELDRVLAIKAKQDKKEGDGAAKESDIRANYRNLNNTIMQLMAGPGRLTRDPDGTLVLKESAPQEVRDRISKEIQRRFESSKLTDTYRLPDGSLPLEVRRVISSFVEPVSPVETPVKGGAAEKPVPAEAAKTTSAAKAGALPIPRTAKGEVDVNKLVNGKVYVSTKGEYRIWNGSGWQPVSE